MKRKNSFFVLMVAVGIFCCGCTSLVTEENPASEVNEGGIESESIKETNHDQQVSYEEYNGNWTTGGITYDSVFLDGGTVFSATINGNNLQGSIYSVQEITQRIAEIDNITGVIENGVCRYEFLDDGQGDRGTLYIKFLENRIEIEVEDFVMADENVTGFAVSGSYTLLRAAEDDPDPVITETTSSGTSFTESLILNETSADWQEIYYERYYAIWDSEETMLSEIENRSIYRENCSFYNDAVYYIQGVEGGYMIKTDISYLVEPLYPTDLVYIDEEAFKDYPPLLLHLLKNEMYARHGYIFSDQDLDNYFRGLIWYTPQKEGTEFDDSVFNEIKVHNLDILARLDNYICTLPLYEP